MLPREDKPYAGIAVDCYYTLVLHHSAHRVNNIGKVKQGDMVNSSISLSGTQMSLNVDSL